MTSEALNEFGIHMFASDLEFPIGFYDSNSDDVYINLLAFSKKDIIKIALSSPECYQIGDDAYVKIGTIKGVLNDCEILAKTILEVEEGLTAAYKWELN